MRILLVAGLAALTAAACQTPVETAEAKVDARQGEEVNQVCFTQQIRNWKANDSRSVIVEKGLRDEYKLDLVGTCDPRDAFMSIGLVSRVGGGSCLSRGDTLVTDARNSSGPCSIQRIYKWKPVEPAPATAS